MFRKWNGQNLVTFSMYEKGSGPLRMCTGARNRILDLFRLAEIGFTFSCKNSSDKIWKQTKCPLIDEWIKMW